jgi:hypothetical protein
MKFLDLVNLVEALSNSSAANILVLDLYKELAKSTLASVFSKLRLRSQLISCPAT